MVNLITVIVPVYKIKEEFLRRCIESLLNQGQEDYRIILVDDGSPDDCGKICDEYEKTNSIVSVIHQKNQGVSVARNTGIKATETKWLTFVDADDWVEPDYISTLYGELNGNAEKADILMFEYSREYKNNSRAETLGCGTGYLNSEMLDLVKKATFYKLLINGKNNPYTVIAIWDKVYKTSFLKEQGLWFIPEARKGQDRLYNADALNSTSKIYYLNKVLYRYRCWEESRTNRYDENIPNLTAVELKSLQSVVEKYNLENEVGDYLKCRMTTRLYTCMRLYYFHDENKMPMREKIKSLRALIEAEPYKTALKSVDMKLLNTQEKLFAFFLKAKMYRVVYVLVKVKSESTKKKLS